MKTKATACLLMFCISACLSEVNVVDPQESSSIQESKLNKLFICQYRNYSLENSDFQISEIWVEDCWKKSIKSGNIIKSKTSDVQLILKLDSNSAAYGSDEYLIKWRFEVDKVGVFGRSGNVYSLFMKSEDIKDTISIDLLKFKNDSSFPQLKFKIIKHK